MLRMAEAVCTYALGEYRFRGFCAYEKDDHTLVLEHSGEVVKEFHAPTAKPEEIQQACCQHLSEDIAAGRQ